MEIRKPCDALSWFHTVTDALLELLTPPPDKNIIGLGMVQEED